MWEIISGYAENKKMCETKLQSLIPSELHAASAIVNGLLQYIYVCSHWMQ